jgi:hypothetical protein
MFWKSLRPFRKRTVLILSVLLFGALAVGAGIAISVSADSSKNGAEDKDSGGRGHEQALAFAQCMRDHGIPNYPDPQQQGGRVQLNSGLNQNTPVAEKAMAGCRELMPQGLGAGPGGSLDGARVSAWVKCLRQNGVPAFPDPDIQLTNMKVDVATAGIDPRSTQFQKAIKACQSRYPGGTLELQRPGGGQ